MSDNYQKRILPKKVDFSPPKPPVAVVKPAPEKTEAEKKPRMRIQLPPRPGGPSTSSIS